MKITAALLPNNLRITFGELYDYFIFVYMKQLTVNIPDNYFPKVIEFISHIPEASILNESDFIVTPEILSILDESHALDNSKFYSLDESNKLLKDKYGL